MPPTIEAMADDFLARITALQPHGPYRLGGFCLGGVIAFEIAQRLTARGFTVDRLVAVNAPAPERRFSTLGRIARALAPHARISPRRRQVMQLLLVSRIVRIRAALRRGPAAALEEIADVVRSFTRGAKTFASAEEFADPALDDRAFETLLQAQRNYRARPYAGRIALFWAEGEPMLYDCDPTNGWQRFTAGVDVVPIQGDHMSSVVEHGKRVGELIRAALSESPAFGAGKPASLRR
jgi:thioesterase domain-containing protein